MGPEDFMQAALVQARQGDSPYGAVIVKDGEIVARAHNTVQRDHDPSAHAEVNVIRQLTARLGSPSLAGYSLYTTCEPCPMCATLCLWAELSEIVFGASIGDLIAAGVPQIDLACAAIVAQSSTQPKISQGLLKAESLRLFEGR